MLVRVSIDFKKADRPGYMMFNGKYVFECPDGIRADELVFQVKTWFAATQTAKGHTLNRVVSMTDMGEVIRLPYEGGIIR